MDSSSSEQRTHRTTLDGTSVDYVVRRSNRATRPRIDVRLAGVRVVLPSGSPMDHEALLERNADWTLRKLDARASTLERVPERRFEPGSTLPYLGTERTIRIEQRSKSAVCAESFRLASWEVERTSVKNVLESLFRRKARTFVEEQIDSYGDCMGVNPSGIRIANQRTKWGSCSSNGTVSFNWRLMLAPPEIPEYVVVHELAHLRELNHSDRFWEIVAEHDPDWQAHAEWLEENGVTLVFDRSDL
ncbi:SprT family zinc-dependent metalloprotease [Halolamina sp.]|uniref:M48 family metallopeptidase n=1 Tax=Halolamina sp. TaxID=1940283 RepID=UPI00067782B8